MPLCYKRNRKPSKKKNLNFLMQIERVRRNIFRYAMQSKVYYNMRKRPACDQNFWTFSYKDIWNQYYLFSCRSWMEKCRSLEESWFIMKNSSEHTKDETTLPFKLSELKYWAWKDKEILSKWTWKHSQYLCFGECSRWQPLLSQQLQPFLPTKNAIFLNKN